MDRMRRVPLVLLAFGALLLGAGGARAELSPPDQAFATSAASGGLAEIQLAQVALQKATSSEVRQFARRMVADHGAANQALQQIADDQGLTLPEQPAPAALSVGRRLRGTTGNGFDQAYIQQMIRYHQQDLMLFRRAAQSAQDPDLKAFAQKALPMIQQHLQLARSLDRPA
jgi:putative membrane protein